eukprot:IDg12746t1
MRHPRWLTRSHRNHSPPRKRNGSVLHITVGETLRMLVGKLWMRHIKTQLHISCHRKSARMCVTVLKLWCKRALTWIKSFLQCRSRGFTAKSACLSPSTLYSPAFCNISLRRSFDLKGYTYKLPIAPRGSRRPHAPLIRPRSRKASAYLEQHEILEDASDVSRLLVFAMTTTGWWKSKTHNCMKYVAKANESRTESKLPWSDELFFARNAVRFLHSNVLCLNENANFTKLFAL